MVTGGRAPRLPVTLIGAAVLVVLAAVAFLVLGGSDSPEEEIAALPPVGEWTEAPGLASIRGSTAAVVLDDGGVLAAGGGVGAIALQATELFDAEARTWQQVAPMAEARRGHRGVVLGDGRVLVAGGLAEGVPLASAEIYDPETNVWSSVAPMSVPRLGHSLTVLPDGRVLAAGGSARGPDEAAGGGQTIRTVATSEIFDPATLAWSPAAEMTHARFEHTANLLADGRVLMVGGLGPSEGVDHDIPLRSTEIYDPAADAFLTSTDLAEGRANHAAALLNENAVVVTGGVTGEQGDLSITSAEVFDSRAATWTTVGSMGTPRTGHTATALEDGRILVVGGETVRRGSRRSLTSAEMFDFDLGASGEWRSAGDMACPRSEHEAVLLDDGSVLAIAGDAAFPGQAPMAQSCVGRYQP